MMKFMLRSPLHGMVSKKIMLITFSGRKTGKTYTTPVSYSQHNDQVYVFTHANWWKNLATNDQVTLRLRGREIQGEAEPIAEDKQAIAKALAAHLKKVPSDAGFYHVTFDEHKNPKADEIAAAVQSVVMISIRLC
jgi:deazaflavin-dependent oxidoreductase (nitroreductase family)